MDQFSKEGRRLRPRKTAAASATGHSERVEYKSYTRGERPEGAASGERRSYGERKSYGAGRPSGERRTYSRGERPAGASHGERRSYGEGRPTGERRSYSRSERPAGEHRSFNGERRSFDGERKPYSRSARPAGDRKPFAAKGGKRPYAKNRDLEFTTQSEEGISRMISRRPLVSDPNRDSDFDGAAVPVKNEIRLNKFIANSGVCSRREADTLIQAGVVTVNGEVVTELGTKVNVFDDDIRFNGERLKGEEKVYIVMNKPKGFVTTSSDPHAEKTVMELLQKCEARVFPVGRLDKNTTGVLMFTNDGEIAERLTHPSYDKKKIYQVILNNELKQEDYDKILAGVELTDGVEAADSLEYIDENDKRKLGIEIHSGKNRIVRRIFESLGYDVRVLDRVYFAGLTKKGLKKGEWRFLTEQETNILKMGAYI